MTDLKWAMVGTGLMAELILKDFELAENTQLEALVSRDPAKAQSRLDEFGISARALTFDQALADDQIDVIYVASPHSEHFEMAKAALEAGKHVLVEKSFMMNAAESIEIAALAKAKSRFLMEAMWTKFLPMHNAIKKMIVDGELGELVCIQTNFGYAFDFDATHRLFSSELGGGSTLDQAIYTTTFNRWMAGSPIKRQISFGKRFTNGVDSHTDTTFEFENGVVGHGVTSLISPLGFAGKIVGTKKSIEITNQFWNARECDFVDFDRDGVPTRVNMQFETKGKGYAHMLEHVSQAILAGKLESEHHPLSFTIEMLGALDEIRTQIK